MDPQNECLELVGSGLAAFKGVSALSTSADLKDRVFRRRTQSLRTGAMTLGKEGHQFGKCRLSLRAARKVSENRAWARLVVRGSKRPKSTTRAGSTRQMRRAQRVLPLSPTACLLISRQIAKWKPTFTFASSVADSAAIGRLPPVCFRPETRRSAFKRVAPFDRQATSQTGGKRKGSFS